MFETYDEANQRLTGCIIGYKNRPMIVRTPIESPFASGKPCSLEIRSPRGGDVVVVSVDDKDLNFHDFNLGYVFDEDWGSSVYVARKPARRYKQGLNQENICIFRCSAEMYNPNWSTVSSTKFFCERTFPSNYPGFPATMEAVMGAKGEYGVVPFSRQFGVMYDDDVEEVYLYRRTRKIGKSTDGGESFKLFRKYKFLKETLDELKVRAA